MKRPYSDAELTAYSDEHVWYEVWMFFEVVTALTRVSASASSYVSSTTSGPTTVAPPLGVPNSIAPGSAPRPSTVVNNTQIERFMAHLRNLIEFLFTLKPGDTDVTAVDFCRTRRLETRDHSSAD